MHRKEKFGCCIAFTDALTHRLVLRTATLDASVRLALPAIFVRLILTSRITRVRQALSPMAAVAAAELKALVSQRLSCRSWQFVLFLCSLCADASAEGLSRSVVVASRNQASCGRTRASRTMWRVSTFRPTGIRVPSTTATWPALLHLAVTLWQRHLRPSQTKRLILMLPLEGQTSTMSHRFSLVLQE